MKRTISLLITAIMILCLVPLNAITAFATNTAKIKVENVSATPDSTVDVTISITDNPGIASIGLTLSFDEALTLIGASNGEAFSELTMTPPAQLKKNGSVSGSCRFAWLGNENASEDGVILNLKFKVSENAELNKDCVISLVCESGDVLDEARNTVNVTTENGKITVIDYTPGDVDGTGTINMMDVLTLCQYYVDGCQYDPDGYAINLNPECGDVDANGKVNMMDVLMICQYYVDGCKYDPDGYAVKLMPGKVSCNHTMEHFTAKSATCTEDGNIEYWHCNLCGKYFSDAEGQTEIMLSDTVVNASGHKYSAMWSYDDEYHWHEMDCGHENDENIYPFNDLSEHVFDENTHTCFCGKKEPISFSFIDYNDRTIATQVAEYGNELIFADIINVPEREGYVFVGWEIDGTIKENIIITESFVAKAIFMPTYSVLFVSNNTVYDVQVVKEGENAIAPSTNPVLDGHEFVGWENYDVITSDRIVNAIFNPIQYKVSYIMPDGIMIGESQTISYGSVAIAPDVEEYWFDWETHHMYMFTNWMFAGKSNWDYSDIEAEVISQYDSDPTKIPEIMISANYSTEYSLPIVVVEEGTEQSSTSTLVNLSIVLPADVNLNCYLYAVDLRFSFGENLSITENTINPSTALFNETTSSIYNNKTRMLNFMWTSKENGVTYSQQQIIDTVKFSRANSQIVVCEDNFVLNSESSVVIAESEDSTYSELQKITPIVVYKK